MNKGFFKYIFKLIIFFLIIWGIFVLAVRKLGMYIYDEEYASYKQTMDYVTNSNEYNKNLIFGDSVAKAGIIPKNISDDTYNISLAGATTIEEYYILQDYLENHEPPKNLIMMYFIGAYDSIDECLSEIEITKGFIREKYDSLDLVVPLNSKKYPEIVFPLLLKKISDSEKMQELI